jgi:hypothetical protein
MSLFYQVKEIQSSDFQAAIDIYEEAFPDKERVSRSFLIHQLSNNTDLLFVKK